MVSSMDALPGRSRADAHCDGRMAKRALDVAIAFAGLVCLAPVMACTALAVLVETGRPIFFSQPRLGQFGRCFRLYKFRKFHAKGQAGGCPVTLSNDPRMTRVGRFLMRTKFDELPQLWNVLKGEMSLVGPRPETLDLMDCFEPAYARILDYKPGIFGPSQVLFRDESSLYEGADDPERLYRQILFPMKARADLAYYPFSNVLSDMGWIACGIFAVMNWRLATSRDRNLLDRAETWIQRKRQGQCANVAGNEVDYVSALSAAPARILTSAMSAPEMTLRGPARH